MKIFKPIKMNFFTQKKTKQYLLYAIGEIILVVVGILIALQINNQNQIRLSKKEEIKTLKSLRGALKNNLAEFVSIYENQTIRYESLQKSLVLNTKDFTTSDLDYLIGLNSTSYTYNPSLGIYNAIINSGKIELISNDSLKNNISKLKDKMLDYQEEEEEVANFTRQYLYDFFIKEYKIDPSVLIPTRQRTKEEEITDKQFYTQAFKLIHVRNMYFLLLNSMDNVIVEGKILKGELEKLLQEIDIEIKKNN